MRLTTLAATGVLTVLLGLPALNAQDPKPQQEEPRQQEPRPEPHRKQEAAPPQQNREMNQENQKAQEKAQKEEKKQDRKEESKAPREEARPQENGNQRAQQERGMEHGRPAGKTAHIPDDKFRQHFGRQHTVVINRPVIVEGQPRFQYGGYWFVISDPWPAEWAYTDECYIDYMDGEYYMFDLAHPGFRIALFVVE